MCVRYYSSVGGAMDIRWVKTQIELRDDEKQSIIRALIPYNSLSEDLGGFREMLMPGCFSESNLTVDVRSFWNHNQDIILGRCSSGTLRLNETEFGLGYEVSSPDTSWGKDAVASIRRGDVDATSFGFRTDGGVVEWDESDPNCLVRRVIKGSLIEVSPVVFPAYPTSTVSTRSLLDAFLQEKAIRTGVSIDVLRRKLKLMEV